MQFKSIVTDLDHRTTRQPALERVRQLAHKGDDMHVHLFTCDCMDEAGGGVLFDDKGLQQAREQYMSGVEEWLDECARSLRNDGIDTSISTAWHAPRYEAILDHARDTDADLVIRAAREHSRLERLLISATDWELVRHAPQTVWLVKNAPRSVQSPLNVLAAVDPVHAAEEKLGLDRLILDTAAAIVRAGQGTLHLFHAWQPGAAIAPAVAAGPHVPMPVVRLDADLLENMREQRQEMLRGLRRDYEVADAHVHLAEGSVTGTLDEVVHEHAIDVVVCGGVSRGQLERLVIGSTAESILESVDCDVVVVKPPGRGVK